MFSGRLAAADDNSADSPRLGHAEPVGRDSHSAPLVTAYAGWDGGGEGYSGRREEGGIIDWEQSQLRTNAKI